MNSKTHNPAANVPRQTEDEPRGDRGQGNTTWAPHTDEQGISNRPGDRSRSTADREHLQAHTHEDVIEATVEREENRNAAAATQEDNSNRKRNR